MATKSLKKRIDELVNALGGALTPKLASQIRGDLIELGGLVEAVENGQSAAQQEARIADLETELGNLQVSLTEANSQIDRLREEQEERERIEREINDTQFRILNRLPSEHSGNGLKMKTIFLYANAPVDQTEIHIDWLRNSGLIESYQVMFHSSDSFVDTLWRRSKDGNKLVVAKRLAGEHNEAERKRRQSEIKLSVPDQAVLGALIGRPEGQTAPEILGRVGMILPRSTVATILLILVRLERHGLVTGDSEFKSESQVSPDSLPGQASVIAESMATLFQIPLNPAGQPVFTITDEGLDYLVDRGLL
jgi:hypothetical protein